MESVGATLAISCSHAVHAGRVADQLRRAFDAFQPALEGAILLRELALSGCTRLQQGFDFDQLAGLGEIVERAVAQRGDGRFERRLAGEHDGFGIGRKFLGLGDDFDAVEAGHIEIDEDAIVTCCAPGRRRR